MAHIHIRSRNAGKSFELRIKHRLLDKPIYRTLLHECPHNCMRPVIRVFPAAA